MSEYSHSNEVLMIANALIKEHHPHLEKTAIAYLFTDEKGKGCGGEMLAKAKKASPLIRYFAEVDLVVLVQKERWDGFTHQQRVALVDHELCHFTTHVSEEGEVRYSIRPHDLEEFQEVVGRHGLWKPDVEAMRRVMPDPPQMDLPIPKEDGRERQAGPDDRQGTVPEKGEIVGTDQRQGVQRKAAKGVR